MGYYRVGSAGAHNAVAPQARHVSPGASTRVLCFESLWRQAAQTCCASSVTMPQPAEVLAFTFGAV
jgi:hypothetical protein